MVRFVGKLVGELMDGSVGVQWVGGLLGGSVSEECGWSGGKNGGGGRCDGRDGGRVG